jgi:hypothetical protein
MGLLDEIRIDLVPVFLGEGVRYFDHINNDKADLRRAEVVEGEGVTHLRYDVHYRWPSGPRPRSRIPFRDRGRGLPTALARPATGKLREIDNVRAHPCQRGVPVDGLLVGGPGLDVVDVAELGHATRQLRLGVRVLDG